jgi:Fe-S-cluster-containing hydrogenase component 2
MLEKNGVPSDHDLDSVKPSEERFRRGPVAIVECFERIPCDPCFHLCKQGAIRSFRYINDLPEIDFEKCTGCGICIGGCPGLAIFVVDVSAPSQEGSVSLPYEFLPLPKKEEEVLALDRQGDVVGKGTVLRVQRKKNKRSVITIAVPKDLVMVVRNIRPQEESYAKR